MFAMYSTDGGEFKYNILTNIDEPPQKFKPRKHKFVEGILQNEGYDYLFKKNNLNINNNIEYNSWHRSHGGDWNTKYSANKIISTKLNIISQLHFTYLLLLIPLTVFE